MTIDEFLGKLEKVQSDGKGGWVACCPAHDDTTPSMHVNLGDDGRILVHCFTGCTVEEICSAIGIEVKDLMAEKPSKGKRRKGSGKGKAPKAVTAEAIVAGPSFAAPKAKRDYGKFVCEYVYKREDGAAVFKVVRRLMSSGKKTFVQMSPDPDKPGAWRFGVEQHGVEYIPYQVPLIRKAAEGGKPVIIVEGEKDVETVVKRLHLAATCNAKGAGKWQAGWGKYFTGVPKILIVADKDAETKEDRKTGEEKPFAVGQRHACDVEAKLRADGYAGEIRKVCMPDVEIEQGVTKRVKDFTDWVEAMDAANRAVDKSAFHDAIEAFGAWPERWNFTGADLVDLQRAQKEARNTLLDMPGEAAEGEGTAEEVSDKGEMGEAGRYGRLSPVPPLKDERTYQVDFEIKAGNIARLEVGKNYFRFEGWKKCDVKDSDKYGKYVKDQTYSPVKCNSYELFGLAYGAILNWQERHFKPNAGQVSNLTSSLIMAYLRARGKFFGDVNNPNYGTSMFFDEQEGILYKLHSDEFRSFLATVSDVNRESKTFKFMTSLIDDLAMESKITPRVNPSKQWERKGDVIYLSCGDSEMYRIAANSIERVANGVDGVVFVRGETLEPWTLKDGAGLDPFVDSVLFKNAAWADGDGRMNTRLWFLNLFACHKNKPILLVTGPARSGKTRLALGLKEILGVRDDGKTDTTVTSMDPSDKGQDSFWVIIDNGRLEVFDNFDAKIKWASNDLQTAATNGSSKRREKYKDSAIVILRPNASIVLTSNNPVFASDGGGLTDRIIPIYLNAGRKVSLGGELAENIARNRGEYLTWIARTLSVALADKNVVDQSINKRHPDYGSFAIKCARALGMEREAIMALSAAEINKSILPLMNETVAKEIFSVLIAQEKPGSLAFTAGDMSEMIIKRIGEDETDEKTKQIYGPRRVGKALSKLASEFGTIFRMGPTRLLDGRTKYDFTGLTAQGEAVLSSASSGLVGLNTAFGKSSHVGEVREGFSENGTTNALNPLHARAPGCDTFSDSIKGRDREDAEDEESDTDDFDF